MVRVWTSRIRVLMVLLMHFVVLVVVRRLRNTATVAGVVLSLSLYRVSVVSILNRSMVIGLRPRL